MSSTKTAPKKQLKEEVKPEVKPVVPEKTDDEVEVEDADADDSKKVTFEQLTDTFLEKYKEVRQGLLALGGMAQHLRRAHNQAMRQQSAKKKVRKQTVDSGILKPVSIPPEASAFLKAVGVDIPENNLLRRTELSKIIYEYIKKNTLYKPDPSKDSGYDRKVILPDVKLRTLFSLTQDKTLDFSSINVNLAVIYKRAKEHDAETSGSAPVAPAAPAPAVKAAAPAAPAKKGKVAGSSA